MGLLTLDFETYYDYKYSLRAKEYNLSEYIRDPQFLTHCCSIKVGKKKVKCYKGIDLPKVFADIDWANTDMMAHNNAFDGAILAWHYGYIPKRYLDTLSMTRGLHADMTRAGLDVIAQYYGIGAKSATYLTPTKGLRELPPAIYKGLAEGCDIDTDLCYEIGLKQLEVFPEEELRLIDMVIRMFVTPVLKVDIPRAKRALEYEMHERLRAIVRSRVDEKVLTSSPKFAAALEELGVEVPMKVSPKSGHTTTAFAQTDPGFVELLNHDDIRVIRLVQGRLAAKSTIIETRAYRLIKAGANGQNLPVLLNYFGAKTGRFSGGNKLNMQNLNRQEYDDETGKPIPMTGELRKSIIAPPGHIVLVADSAQIEARTLAWMAGQTDLVESFRNRVDVYSAFASFIYGRPINKKDDPNERFVGKVGILGLGYGMGALKFRTTLAIGSMGPPVFLSADVCAKAVKTYRKVNAEIPKLWKEGEKVLMGMSKGNSGVWGVLEYEGNTIWLPNGMPLNYPGLRPIWDAVKDRLAGFDYLSNGFRKKIYGGLLVENIIQALARVVVTTQMLWTDDYYKTLKLRKGEIAQIASMSHDEIISVVPARLAEKALIKKIEIMRIAPAWAGDLPLDAEGGYDVVYSK